MKGRQTAQMTSYCHRGNKERDPFGVVTPRVQQQDSHKLGFLFDCSGCIETVPTYNDRKEELPMAEVPDKNTFASLYSGQAPWDIGKPQKPFIESADQITGSVLDAGCGTGDTALFLASRGNKITGIDFLEEPIKRAKRKAAERGLAVTFLVQDATKLGDWTERFDSVIDSGLFHVFNDEDRKKYIAGLATVLKPGGHLFVLCFSDEEPGTQGPRRISKKELHDAFAKGWSVESINPAQVEVIPDLKGFTFSEGGPKAWFAVIRRE
jgi:SAM-dependent methyltransferase